MKRRGAKDKIHEGLGEALPIHITTHRIMVLPVCSEGPMNVLWK